MAEALVERVELSGPTFCLDGTRVKELHCRTSSEPEARSRIGPATLVGLGGSGQWLFSVVPERDAS